MFSEDISRAEMVMPRNFTSYLINKGWKKTNSKFTDVAVYRSGAEEIVVPIEKSLDDYNVLMLNAVQKISSLEKQSKNEIINLLSMPTSDIVNFRLEDSSTKEGFISLSKGPNFLLSCQRALLAAACSVEDPQTHYPKLSRLAAKSFLDECKFNTKSGSFVVNIMCPLNAVDENTISENARKFKISQDETFTRSVSRRLMASVSGIVKYIDSGNDDKAFDSLNFISSNFCKALLGMCPDSESSSLIVSAATTYGGQIAPAVKLPRTYFKDIEKLLARLTPSSDPMARFFTGLVTDLHGERTESGKPAGDVEITFQYDDEDIVKARVSLDVDHYAVALKAHGNGHYVSFKGTLKLGARSHKITDVQGFKDLQSG